jgi:hypothetical protein
VTVAESSGAEPREDEAHARWAWIAVALGAWIIGGVYLVSGAIERGDTSDVGMSPYHVVGYGGLLALAAISLWLVIRARRRGLGWRRAFPPGLGSLGAGLLVALAYVVIDVAWREGVGINPGVEEGFAPSRVLLLGALVLIAMAPLRASLLAGAPRSLRWPAAVSAGLLAASIAALGGLHPVSNPWLEEPENVVDDNAEIWIMDADGGRQTRLIEAVPGIELQPPAWSPDGSQIAYARFSDPASDPSTADYDIWVVNADGTDPHPVAVGPAWQWLPRWSRDGAWIGYTEEAVGGPWLASGPMGPALGQGPQGPVFPVANAVGLPEAELWRVHADGSGAPVRITDAAGDDRSGSWSPSGSRLAFDSTRDGNTEIYTVDVDGRNATRLTDEPAEDWAPAFSPDGSKIAFTSDRTGAAQIWLMAADGSGQTQLTDDPIGALWPAWSPDGARILFTGWATGGQQAWSMAADGSDVVNLSRSPGTVDGTWDGSWGPDGRIAFSRNAPAPPGLQPIAREDLGVAAMLISALALALVVGLVALSRPGFGAVALTLGISTALVASVSGEWGFVPAAIVAGLVVDLVLRLTPERWRVAVGASAGAIALVAAAAAGAALDAGIGWSPTLLIGVAVAAALGGWVVGSLLEHHPFRRLSEGGADAAAGTPG